MVWALFVIARYAKYWRISMSRSFRDFALTWSLKSHVRTYLAHSLIR